MKRNIGITVALVYVLSLLGCGSIVQRKVEHHPAVVKILTPPKPDYVLKGTGWTNSVGFGTNAITVLHLECDNHYSQGYWHGKLLAVEARASIKSVLLGARNKIPEKARAHMSDKRQKNIVGNILDKTWRAMRPFIAIAELDEMQGLYAGLVEAGVTDVSLEDIYRVHCVPEISESATCSTLFACGKATRDNEIYQVRILDYLGLNFGLEKHPLIVVYHATQNSEQTFVSFGFAGFIGVITGTNEKLAISEMGYGSPPGETIFGEPMPFLLKRVLRHADSAKVGTGIVRSARRTNSYVYLLGDAAGDAVGIVSDATREKEFWINKQSEIVDRDKIIPQFPDVLYAGHFNEKQGALIKTMHGSIDEASLKDMASKISADSNLHTAIYKVKSGEVLFAVKHGRIKASNCQYIRFNKEMWQKRNNN